MIKDFEDSIGERIRYYRKKAGLTQKALAEACGITEPAIRNYELGNRIPAFVTLDIIADVLGVSYYALADPNLIDSYGVMHALFRMEYLHGLRPFEINGRVVLGVDEDPYGDEWTLIQMTLNDWMEARKKLDSGEWSSEQYEDWESRYPKPESQRRAKGVEIHQNTQKRKRPKKQK